VGVNKESIRFLFFILSFLYPFFAAAENSALADTKPLAEQPLASPLISRPATPDLPHPAPGFNWSTSAADLLPEKQVAVAAKASIKQQDKNTSLTAPQIAPINTPDNNSSLAQQLPTINQQDNNFFQPQDIAPGNQQDNNFFQPQDIAPGNQQDNNVTPRQDIAPGNQQDNNVTPRQKQFDVESLRGNSLDSRQPGLTTAHQLLPGEFLTIIRNRQNFPENNPISGRGLTFQPTIGVSFGITKDLEITLDYQTVDNEGPGRQGAFAAQRTTSRGGSNFFQDFTFQAKYRLWQNPAGTQALGGVFAITRGERSYRFIQNGRVVAGDDTKDQVIPSLEFPYTVTSGGSEPRLQFTLSPKIAFLPEDNALYFRRPPVANPGSFGTTLGLAGGANYRLSSRFVLWGDAFVPFTGNNTINRTTGLPARTVAFNAGLRYLFNPRLAADLFVSNTLGNTGALSLIADRESPFLGLGVTFLPGITSANRRYPTSFRSTQQPPPPTPAGFAFLDGGTIPAGQVLTTVQGGSQGLLAALQVGVLDDLELGAFLDYVSGTTDESQFGFSGKVRFLHQADGDPVTVSAVATLARSNNVLINLLENNANEFAERGLRKGGFAFSNERGEQGELFIITLSAPVNYKFKSGSEVWLTPTLGFIQRNGLQIAGVNLGGSLPVYKNLNAIAEVGFDFSGKGNGFSGNTRATLIPWNLGLRWSPFSEQQNSGVQLEAYLTNRVGSSPFENLRVRSDNSLGVGVGVRLPVQF
jgi:hypothetical protein